MDKKRSCCCGALPPMWWWLLTLLGLPLLFFLMVNTRQGDIENDLAGRATDGLKAAGFDWAKATVAQRGRDVQLQGMAASEEDRQSAAKIAQGIYGVRDVQNMIEVAQVETPGLPQQVAGDAAGTQVAADAAAVTPSAVVTNPAAVTEPAPAPDAAVKTDVAPPSPDAAVKAEPVAPDTAAKAEPTPEEKAVEEKAVEKSSIELPAAVERCHERQNNPV